MNPRFTIDGSAALEQQLAALCKEVAAGVQRIVPAGKLEGLLLGGGYGRGEGGVLRTASGDAPYNDLEFYVMISGPVFLNDRKYGHAMHELGEALTPKAGIEVELKILSAAKLRQSPVSMFYYDLVVGHRQLLGSANLLAGCEHHRIADTVPLHEATRLLMNRCSGLLFAAERLKRPAFTDDDADFVGRNLAKAQLAFGDVALTAHGQYHWSCLERRRRLEQFRDEVPNLTDLQRHHAEGVEFKLHPVRTSHSREELQQRHAELSALGRDLWLWLEDRRLQSTFSSPRDYAFSPADKCPETSRWRNRLVQWRRFGLGAALSANGSRYPRQSLFHALALLLWDENLPRDPQARHLVDAELHTKAADFCGLVAAYGNLWRNFN
jgi:hypothetical protein